MKRHFFRFGLRFAAFAILAGAALGAVVMALWNALLPALFAWPAITFWQAIGLLLLSRLLVGSWRGGHGHHLHWRARFAQRWEGMSDEERARFRAGLQHRCGRSGAESVAPAGDGAQAG
jgi:hypothetical protein